MATNFYSDIYLNANKLGRDADNLLDFTTDNEITFRVGAGDGVVFKASGEIEATKFDGALEGNADTATALATTRAFQTNLASTSSANFDGSAANTHGVTGTLAVGNGGTGVTSMTNLKNALDDETWTFANNTTLAGFVLDGNTITGVDDSGEFTDDDAHIMTSAGINDKFSLIAGSSSITTVGTIGTGTWQGSVIASAYLPTNTAYLTGAQTFLEGAKTFGTNVKLQFRDANAYINSPTANDIEIAATTITLDAASDIQLEQDTTVTGNLTVTGRATSTDDYHGESFENQLSASAGHGRILKYSPGSSGGLTASQIYYLRDGGTWSLADADDVAKGGTQLLGIGMGEDPQTVGVFMEGFFRVASTEILNTPGSGAVDGLPLYVSTTDGHFDFTAPSGSGDYVRIVGYAIDDDSGDVLVYFDPSKDHIVLA